MSITGNEGTFYTVEQAAPLIQNYNDNVGGTTAVLYGKNKIADILNQTECVAIRHYFAQSDTGTNTLVLVGVDASGNDITTGFILQAGTLCPPVCDTASSLYPS